MFYYKISVNNKIGKFMDSLIYKRPITNTMISFSSMKGKDLFRHGLKNNTMEAFFDISQQINTQHRPESCAHASLVPILNALGVNPNQRWKGIWSWYDERNLKGIPKEMMMKPLNLYQCAEVATKNGLDVQIFHPQVEHNGKNQCETVCKENFKDKYKDHHSHEEPFVIYNSVLEGNEVSLPPKNDYLAKRNILAKNSPRLPEPLFIKTMSPTTFKHTISSQSSASDVFMIINYCRQKLEQTGSGHFSPIGGCSYSETENQVLIQDTAKFKYPFYWIELENLYDSIFEIDKDYNRQRGLLILSKTKDKKAVIEQLDGPSEISGCSLFTTQKLEKELKIILNDWILENGEILKKARSAKNIYEFLENIAPSLINVWIKLLVLNKSYIEKQRVLRTEVPEYNENWSINNEASLIEIKNTCNLKNSYHQFEISRDFYPDDWRLLLDFLVENQRKS